MHNDKLKVAFLDRDGVINKEVNYLYKVDDFEYTLDCIEGLQQLQQQGFKLIVITNQAGIARGYYTEADYQKLTTWYVNDLKLRGIDILDVFYCPHHIEGIIPAFSRPCECRKPHPGLINFAKEKYDIDMDSSILVGDKNSDIQAGYNSGIKSCFLVKTGYAIFQPPKNVQVFDTLKSISELLSQNKNYEDV